MVSRAGCKVQGCVGKSWYKSRDMKEIQTDMGLVVFVNFISVAPRNTEDALRVFRRPIRSQLSQNRGHLLRGIIKVAR